MTQSLVRSLLNGSSPVIHSNPLPSFFTPTFSKMMESSKGNSRQSQDRESSETLLSSLPEQEYEYGDLEKLRKRPSRFRPLLCHGIILIIYTLLFLAASTAIIPTPQNCHDDKIYTPARPAVKWIRKHQENVIGKTTPYMGKPSPEGDEAWRELLQNSNIRVSEDTLRKMNRSSIALQDGSGMYMAGLSVHHHLHCVVSYLGTSVGQDIDTSS